MLDYYLHTGACAGRLLVPSTEEPAVLVPASPGTAPEQLADRGQALAWFTREHHVLLAAISLAAESGFDSHAWQLPWALMCFLQTCGYYQEGAAIQRTALTAAERLGDTAAQAICTRLLASACLYLGDDGATFDLHTSSLALYQRLGDRRGEGRVHVNLGVLADRQGRYEDALRHADQALRLYKSIGDRTSEAEALNNLGWAHGLLGNYQQTRELCRQALSVAAEVGYTWLEGHVWDSLGYAEHHLGNFGEAVACYQRALSLHRESGDRFNEADTLTHLGDTRDAAGELAEAREAWEQALTLFEDLQQPEAVELRAKLAAVQ
jgi:tetratricopeptide (TPR) repeat protein